MSLASFAWSARGIFMSNGMRCRRSDELWAAGSAEVNPRLRLLEVHGKLFTAFASPQRRFEVLAEPRRKHTPHTVTDKEELEEELERVADEGVAYDQECRYPGICSVGSPVRDQLGNVVAAVSVVMPTGRFGPKERDLCVRAVKETAASLSAYLAGTRPGRCSGLPSRGRTQPAKGSPKLTFDDVRTYGRPASLHLQSGCILRYQPGDAAVRVLSYPHRDGEWDALPVLRGDVPQEGWMHVPGCSCNRCRPDTRNLA